ncbi:MAG: hypothetical protein ABIG20_04460 [archaeon]
MGVPLTFTPVWFSGYDIIFDIISLLVAVGIFYFSYRAWKVIGAKSYSIMFYSFAMIAFSFLIKIFANFARYYSSVRAPMESVVTAVTSASVVNVYLLGVFFYRAGFLFSLALLFWLTLKTKDKRVLALLMMFAVISTELSFTYYSVFHMVAAAFLLFIFSFFQYNYAKKKSGPALQIMLAFFFILVSQAAFVFMILEPTLYALGMVAQLIGYGILLFNIISVFKR